MGRHGVGARGLQGERNNFVVKRGEHRLVVALDDHQGSHHTFQQEGLVVEQPSLRRQEQSINDDATSTTAETTITRPRDTYNKGRRTPKGAARGRSMYRTTQYQ